MKRPQAGTSVASSSSSLPSGSSFRNFRLLSGKPATSLLPSFSLKVPLLSSVKKVLPKPLTSIKLPTVGHGRGIVEYKPPVRLAPRSYTRRSAVGSGGGKLASAVSPNFHPAVGNDPALPRKRGTSVSAPLSRKKLGISSSNSPIGLGNSSVGSSALATSVVSGLSVKPMGSSFAVVSSPAASSARASRIGELSGKISSIISKNSKDSKPVSGRRSANSDALSVRDNSYATPVGNNPSKPMTFSEILFSPLGISGSDPLLPASPKPSNPKAVLDLRGGGSAILKKGLTSPTLGPSSRVRSVSRSTGSSGKSV